MNATSSRSHAIFSVILKQQIWVPSCEKVDQKDETSVTSDQPPADKTAVSGFVGAELERGLDQNNGSAEGSWQRLTSKFHFVDLGESDPSFIYKLS